jgi:hypothetical protein
LELGSNRADGAAVVATVAAATAAAAAAARAVGMAVAMAAVAEAAMLAAAARLEAVRGKGLKVLAGAPVCGGAGERACRRGWFESPTRPVREVEVAAAPPVTDS